MTPRNGVSGQEICLEWQSAQFERDTTDDRHSFVVLNGFGYFCHQKYKTNRETEKWNQPNDSSPTPPEKEVMNVWR